MSTARTHVITTLKGGRFAILQKMCMELRTYEFVREGVSRSPRAPVTFINVKKVNVTAECGKRRVLKELTRI